MSSESRRRAHEQRVRSSLRPDVGPVEDETCERSHCEEAARYRVPWPHIGGDVAYCSYHLAQYRHNQPEIWRRLRDIHHFEDPQGFASRGDRFLELDEVPEQLTVHGELMNRVALGVDGRALFDSDQPDRDGSVRFATVGRDLEAVDCIEIHREKSQQFIDWFRDHRGVDKWDPDVRPAVNGGEQR